MEGFSFTEIIFIMIIAILIYGKDLPQAARKLATMYSKFKRQLNDVRSEIARQIPMDEIQNSVRLDLPSGPGGEPPTTPSTLVASVTPGQVLLTWNSSVGATSYTIRRSTGPQDPWLICAMNIYELAWTDTDVQPGKTYHYVVSGVNTTGESGNSDEAVAVMPADPASPGAAAGGAPGSAPSPTAADAAASALPTPSAEAAPKADPPPPPPAPEAKAPSNGNGDYPHEPPLPEEKGTTAPRAAPEARPS